MKNFAALPSPTNIEAADHRLLGQNPKSIEHLCPPTLEICAQEHPKNEIIV